MSKSGLVKMLLTRQKKAIYEQIIKELREYYQKYPDANYHDINGYIARMAMRSSKPLTIKKP